MKIYRIYRDVANKKAAEEIVEELNNSSEARWHLTEIDTDTKEQNKLM